MNELLGFSFEAALKARQILCVCEATSCCCTVVKLLEDRPILGCTGKGWQANCCLAGHKFIQVAGLNWLCCRRLRCRGCWWPVDVQGGCQNVGQTLNRLVNSCIHCESERLASAVPIQDTVELLPHRAQVVASLSWTLEHVARVDTYQSAAETDV